MSCQENDSISSLSETALSVLNKVFDNAFSVADLDQISAGNLHHFDTSEKYQFAHQLNVDNEMQWDHKPCQHRPPWAPRIHFVEINSRPSKLCMSTSSGIHS